MTVKTEHAGRAAILYDDALLDHADMALFTPPSGAERVLGGRGSAWSVRVAGNECVLRHYWRGGLPGRFIRDRYLWTGLEATRAWREWRLLHALYKEGLPVPQPLAARVERGGFFYRADLITRRIPGACSVAARLIAGDAARLPWTAVGACVRRLHAAGVWHADLNTHNLLVDAAGRIYVIDFDRGRRRAPARAWQQANLARLARSLRKVSPGGAATADMWAAFMDGYGASG